VGSVVVEGSNHIVAVLPRQRPQGVGVVARCLGETDEVEPVAPPGSPVVWTGGLPIDETFVSVGRIVRQEVRDFVRSWWDSGQVDCGSADQSSLRSWRIEREAVFLKTMQQQGVDGISARSKT